MLRARATDTDVIGLLKGVITDEISGHLAGECHKRNRVHVSVGQTRDDVGHAGPRGHQYNAGFSCGLGITLGHVRSALLMAREYQIEVFLLAKHIENF